MSTDLRPGNRAAATAVLATLVALAAFPDAAGARAGETVRVGVHENAPVAFLDRDGRPQGLCLGLLRHTADIEGRRPEGAAGTPAWLYVLLCVGGPPLWAILTYLVFGFVQKRLSARTGASAARAEDRR